MMPVPSAAEVELNCVRTGAGGDLVLIHGLGANLSFWFFGAAQLLAARHRVVMYDLRGHGRSPMPRSGYSLGEMAGDLRLLLDRFGIAQADIVGHSFGGRVALTFALEHPERVRNLIIADTQLRALQAPVRLRDWPHWSRWKTELQALGLQNPPSDDRVIDYKLLAELGSAGDIANTGTRSPRRIALRSRQMGARGGQRWQQLLQQTTAAGDFEDEAPLDRASLATIVTPTLLMFGELSHCLPTAQGLLDLLPDVRLMTVPGAGHFFPVVKPIYFERGLNSFLNRSDPEGGGLAAGHGGFAARTQRRALA